MKQSMKRLNIRVLYLFLLCSVGLLIWWVVFVPRDAASTKKILFHVEKGEGSREIAYHLEQQGIIRSAPMFRVYALTRGISGRLQAGNYLLSPSLSMAQIAEKLAKGDIATEKLKIVEGWNIQDITNYLADRGFAVSISPELEGYLFPDTYLVSRGISGETLIEIMRKNFEKKFDATLKQETEKQNKTVHDIVTMASLIEKEVQTREDKRIVAGILWKRLQYGIALQVDAEPQTYKQRGLPLAPIANPGLESIKAALYPQESPYLYYLSAKKDGETIFSKTLEEHNIAKARYLK